jgi:transcriptional regulator with XRE-family HTH domain
MSAHPPHKQLKTIRDCLGITQQKAAAMLGVSYPYFLSVETGQREISQPLIAKIGNAFGVTGIKAKNAKPMIRDPKTRNLVPFTKQRYLEFTAAPPRFFIDPEYTFEPKGKVVAPTVDDYARCAHALLAAAEEQRTLHPTIAGFAKWFSESVTSDAVFESLKRKFDEMFPGQRKRSEAFLALTVEWGKIVEDQHFKHQLRAAARAKRARTKRGRRSSR